MFISAAEAVILKSLRFSILALNAVVNPVTLLCAIANSLSFVIEPASCVFVIHPDFTLTAPLLISKSALAKDATPLFDAVASSASIVNSPVASL